MARFAGRFPLLRSHQKPLELLGIVGLGLVSSASLTSLQGLPPSLGLVPALALGASIGWAFIPLRRGPAGLPDWIGPLLLGLGPLLLDLLLATTTSALSATGADSAGSLFGLLSGAAVGATIRRSSGGLPRAPAAALGVGLGILPCIYGIVPRLGPVLTAVVGGCFLVAASLSRSLPSTHQEVPATERSIALGILWGGGLPLLVLLGSPIFGPSIPWLGEAVAGVALGFLIARLRASSRGVPPVLGGLLLLGLSEFLLRSPTAIAWLLEKGMPPEWGPIPLAASLVSLCLFGSAGTFLSGKRVVGPGLVAGVLLWLVLPSLVGLEQGLRLVVALATGAAVLEVTPNVTVKRRALTTAAALGSLAMLTAPLAPRGIQVVAPYESYTNLGVLSHLLRTASWRDAQRLDSASGSLLWFDDDDTLVWWQGGRAGREDRIALASDRLFAHLPSLLGSEAESIGVLNPGAGGTLDAARNSSRGNVEGWVRSAAQRLFLQLEAPGQVTADPSVRLRVGYGGAAGNRSMRDVLLIDLPAPWQPGGISAWSTSALRNVSRQLPDGGVAVFRVPLGHVAAPSLASLVQILATEFQGLEAWLDPTGSEHFLLLARHQDGLSEAGAIFRAFTRRSVREALEPAALRQPADVLERFLLGREGLLEVLPSHKSWSPATSAILSGLRSRRGATVLPLAELSAGGLKLEQAIDFSTVPEGELEGLMSRLRAALTTRADYLALLEAIASSDGAEALALAGRIAKSSQDPTRDLRSLIQPWMDQGDRFVEQNLLDQAKAEYLIAVSFSPRDPDLNLRLAGVQRDTGELEEARARYEGVRKQQPTSLPAAIGLAAVLERQGKFREGAELLEETEKLHPGEASVLVNLGALHLHLAFGADEVAGKHIARARMLFQTAASLEPRLAQPHGGLAEVFSLLGDHQRAITEIDRAMTLEPSCTYRGWRGQILWELGRSGEAEQELNKALLDCPAHLPALVALGGVLVDRGCYRQGREAWERALNLRPELTAALVNIEQLSLSGVEQALGEDQCQ